MNTGREQTMRRRSLLSLAIRLGLANPRERPDQYLLLLLWTPEESAAIQDALEAFLAELDPELKGWVQKALGAEAFRQGWRERFGEEPSVEAFWLYLARNAVCRRAEGCLKGLCQKEGFAFAKALLDLAPQGGWLLLRRKRGLRLEEPCRKAVLAALREAWADELARKLKEDLAPRADERLAKAFADAPEPLPLRLLAVPVWGRVALDWLEETLPLVQACPPPDARAHALLPPLVQLFDEITAPALAKRRGCRSARPGTPLFAAGARNLWPRLYEAMAQALEAWLARHPGLRDQKRFYQDADLPLKVYDRCTAWLAQLGGGKP